MKKFQMFSKPRNSTTSLIAPRGYNLVQLRTSRTQASSDSMLDSITRMVRDLVASDNISDLAATYQSSLCAFNEALDSPFSTLASYQMIQDIREAISSHYKQMPVNKALELVEILEKYGMNHIIDICGLKDNAFVRKVVDFNKSQVDKSNCVKLQSLSTMSVADIVKLIEASEVESCLLIRPKRNPTDFIKQDEDDAVIKFSLSKIDSTCFTHEDVGQNYHCFYFGYTSFGIHVASLKCITDLVSSIEKSGGKLIPLFVSIDPDRDNSERMKLFLKGFHPSIIGLSGPMHRVKALSYAYFEAGNRMMEYSFDQSSLLYLVDPRGHLVKTLRLDDPWLLFEVNEGLKRKV